MHVLCKIAGLVYSLFLCSDFKYSYCFLFGYFVYTLYDALYLYFFVVFFFLCLFVRSFYIYNLYLEDFCFILLSLNLWVLLLSFLISFQEELITNVTNVRFSLVFSCCCFKNKIYQLAKT